jgi:hypothetical protein
MKYVLPVNNYNLNTLITPKPESNSFPASFSPNTSLAFVIKRNARMEYVLPVNNYNPNTLITPKPESNSFLASFSPNTSLAFVIKRNARMEYERELEEKLTV